MGYLNTYEDIAAYNADNTRPSDESTISLIESEDRIISNYGKNLVLPKHCAQIGDTMIWDTVDEEIKVVKLSTLNISDLQTRYIVCGTVAFRNSQKVWVYGHGQQANQWAANHQIKLSNFTKGSSFTITINNLTTESISYESSNTLAQLATKIQSAITLIYTTGWSATAYSDYILVQLNYYTPVVSTFITSDTQINIEIPTDNYQTKLTGFLQSYTNITRNDLYSTSYGGCNTKRFFEYYEVSGSDETGLNFNTDKIVRKSRFNTTDNPILVQLYGTYENYISQKMVKYPYSKNVILLNAGFEDTKKLANVFYTNHLNVKSPAYPAAYYAFNYSVPNTPFIAGTWYMESVQECIFLKKDITYGTTGINSTNCDKLNLGLIAAKAPTIPANTNYWCSSERYSYYSWYYYSYGHLHTHYKYNSMLVRPLMVFHL